jgi:hypothetical protein
LAANLFFFAISLRPELGCFVTYEILGMMAVAISLGTLGLSIYTWFNSRTSRVLAKIQLGKEKARRELIQAKQILLILIQRFDDPTSNRKSWISSGTMAKLSKLYLGAKVAYPMFSDKELFDMLMAEDFFESRERLAKAVEKIDDIVATLH